MATPTMAAGKHHHHHHGSQEPNGAAPGQAPGSSNGAPAPTGSPAPTTGEGGGASGPQAGGAGAGGGTGATAPATGSGGGWGQLSTRPQTQANTPQQTAQVAGEYAQNLKRDFGLTDAQAAGIVGNLWHESAGMNSGITQGGAIGSFGDHPDDNAHGIGIAQWGGTRGDGLLQYAKANGLDPTSQAANYGYLRQELQGPYKGAIDAVKNSSTVAGATQAFSSEYEKPSDPQMDSRLKYANQTLSVMQGRA
jgi:hypothetical protein